MKKLLSLFFLVFAFAGFLPAHAQEETEPNQLEEISPGDIQPEKFYRAEVIEVISGKEREVGGYQSFQQVLKVKFLSGEEKNREIQIDNESVSGSTNPQTLKVGDKVVVGRIDAGGQIVHYVADRYRLPALGWILAIFFGAAFIFGRRKGLTSILGLLASILVLALFIVPQILDGKNPLAITLVGSFIIAVVSIFLAHGLSKRTAIALLSTILTLGIAGGLAVLFVYLGKLLGLGSEEAFYLQSLPGVSVNLRGLLLGGIIIGTLGVLDDVTTSQTPAVGEIQRANPDLSARELYQRGFLIGREHIASLVNTLALAYAGASLPLFLLFTVNKSQPIWVLLNSELLAEELIRTLVGSTALIFAVPIATFWAAYFLSREKPANIPS